ncbi:hypothetical protein AJ78_08672, partial [Emergomyces pasteurianus Ep9510]
MNYDSDKPVHSRSSVEVERHTVMLSSTMTQIVFKMIINCLITVLDFINEATAAADIKRDYDRQKIKNHASANKSFLISKLLTLLKTLHCYFSERPHSADGSARLNAKSHFSSLFLTVIVMCPVCNSVIKIKTFSVFKTVNIYMQVREQL